MRVTIHTPGVLVEEYDVPDKLAAEPDAAILGAVRRKVPVSSERVDEEPTVFSRGADPIDEAAQRFIAARDALKAAAADARKLVTAAADAGDMSEHALGRKFGVDRNTIRSWRGKGR